MGAMKPYLLLAICAWSVAACATVPKEQAAELAKSGAQVSDAGASDVADLAERVNRQPGLIVLNSTWKTCVRLTDPADCRADRLDPASRLQTSTLARAITLRANALVALADAYRAFGAEAEYDAEGATEAVAGRLETTVNAYAGYMGSQKVALISAPLGIAITQGAGLWARDRQRARLMTGNENLRQAVAALQAALAQERVLYTGLSEALSLQESAAVATLYEAGLIQGTPMLGSLAEGLGVSLTPGAEQVLTRDANARTATLAYLQGRTDGASAAQTQRYVALGQALAKLEQAHRDFERTGQPDIAGLARMVDEVTALIPSPEEAQP